MSHLTYMHAISILFVFCVLTIAKLFSIQIAKNYEGVRELKITMTLAPSGKTSGRDLRPERPFGKIFKLEN